MLRWVTGVNNVASVHPVQERPLDLLPEGRFIESNNVNVCDYLFEVGK